MPTNVVKTAEQERLWNKAKRLAFKRGRGKDFAYIMGIFKQMGALNKSYLNPIQTLAHARVPGQVPSRENLELMKLAQTKPPGVSVARLLALDEPVLAVSHIVDNLGLDTACRNDWTQFLEKALQGATNELTLRQDIISKCLNERLDGVLRLAIMQKALSYWRAYKKSVVQIVTSDELLEKSKHHEGNKTMNKAEARGGKYHRRVPTENGKHKYYYDEDQYRNREDAHMNGEDELKKYLSGKVQKCILKAGDNGCDIKAFESLVKKYGAKIVSDVLRKNTGKLFTFQKGCFKLINKSERFFIPENLNKALRDTPNQGPHKYLTRKRGAHGWEYTYPEDLKTRIVNAILDFLSNPNRELTVGQAARSFRVDKEVAIQALGELEKQGKVQKKGEAWVGVKAQAKEPEAKPTETAGNTGGLNEKSTFDEITKVARGKGAEGFASGLEHAAPGLHKDSIAVLRALGEGRSSSGEGKDAHARYMHYMKEYTRGFLDAAQKEEPEKEEPKKEAKAPATLYGLSAQSTPKEIQTRAHELGMQAYKQDKTQYPEANRDLDLKKLHAVLNPENKVGDPRITVFNQFYRKGWKDGMGEEKAQLEEQQFLAEQRKKEAEKKEEPKLVIPKETPKTPKPKGEQLSLFGRPAEAPKPEAPKPEAPKPEAPKPEAPKELPKPEPVMEIGEVKKPESKAKKEKTPTPGKLEQTGDHIWGSRKDLAALGQITDSKQLEGMSYDDAAYIVRKSRLVPVHDLETLRAMGMTPGTAHMTLAFLASITAKPEDSAAARAAYLDEVREVVGGIEKVKTLDNLKDMLNEFAANRRAAKQWEFVEGSKDKSEARHRIVQLQQENPGTNYGLRYDYRSYSYEIAKKVARPYDALGSRFTQFIDHKGKFYGDAYSTALTADNAWSYNKGPEVTDGWAYLQESDKSKKEAQKEKAEKQKSIHGETKRGWSGAKDVAGEVRRVGGNVDIKEADAERTKNTFGFKEVDYGQANYMSQADREYHTRALEESMHDFSEILGVPKEVLSFNGRLGIAMGARGRGKAAAHYEPIKTVINITKFRGGGSIAHEWGHALDNIIASHYIKSTKGSAKGDTYLTETPGNPSLPKELSEAMSEVLKAIKTPPNPEKAKKEHKEYLDKLNGEISKMTAQNNILVREFKELSDKPKSQETLDTRIKSMKTRMSEWKKQIDETQAKINDKKKRGQRVTVEQEMEVRNREYWIKDYTSKVAKLQSPDALASDADKIRMNQIENEVEALRLPLNRTKEKYTAMSRLDPTVSDYYKSAMLLGKKYWGNPQELFARAFESYVQDSLKSKNRANTYLVDGTNNQYDTGNYVSLTSTVQPYPHGDERRHIGQAIDKLMSVLRDTGALKKALASFYIWV